MTRRPPLPEKDERSEDREFAGDSAPRPTSHRAEAERHIAIASDAIQALSTLPHRKLAAAVVADCIEALRIPKPSSRQAIVTWKRQRQDELDFITDPKASAIWCEAAGIEWDVVVSKLNAQQLLAPFATAA
jgi:hypothetical protein